MNEDLTDIEEILEAVRDAIDTARPVPLSASVMVNREDLLQQIDQVLEGLPEEFRKARWVLKERDEVLDKARRDAEDILAEAREESHRLVSQQEIVKKAAKAAQQLLDDAKSTARERILQAEDYIDQKLGQFEIALAKTHDTVATARTKLRRGAVHADDFAGAASAEEDRFATPPPQHFDVIDQTGEHFFDQDAL
jgi:cell division septum initiation protein DivIVA